MEGKGERRREEEEEGGGGGGGEEEEEREGRGKEGRLRSRWRVWEQSTNLDQTLWTATNFAGTNFCETGQNAGWF